MKWIGSILVAFLVVPATTAFGDIDVTGTWTTEQTDYFTLQVVRRSITLSQSGTSLDWNGNASGTIDPVGGDFSLDGTTTAGPFSGLQVHTEGTVDPDGNRLSGTSNGWVLIHFIPTPVPYDFRAIRDGVSVCGDDIRDADEPCDLGSINGQQQCCDANCALIDPDGDQVCSEIDDCPNDPFSTTCDGVKPFVPSSIRQRWPSSTPGFVSMKFTATITGTEINLIDGIEQLRITDSDIPPSYDEAIDDFTCTRPSERRLDCANTDDTNRLSIRKKSYGAKLKAVLKSMPEPTQPGVGPRHVILTDSEGLVRDAVAPY